MDKQELACRFVKQGNLISVIKSLKVERKFLYINKQYPP